MELPHINHLFKTLGLTDKEAAVYYALNTLEIASASEISKIAKIKRPNTYNLLKNLQKLGIITSFTENKKTFFRTLGISALESCLSIKTDILKGLQDSLPEIQKELTKENADKPKSEKDPIVFEGKAAALQVWYDMLRERPGTTIYDIESSHFVVEASSLINPAHDHIALKEFKAFTKERISKKIKVSFISTAPAEVDTDLANQELMKHTDAVYIPPSLWPWPIELGTYGNKFYFITYESTPRATIIENKILADAFLQMFKTFRAWALKQKNVKNIVRK